MFLVLLYNLLCKTFKDHSSTFAASSQTRAHPSLARALLPDCECKGRAFLHSLQEITEKKCEKNSFAHILPPHSIAKSAVKPIFLRSPTPPFSLQNLRFSHFPRFKSVFGHFFEESLSFFAPRSPLFSRFSSFWVRLRTIFREIFPTFPSALPFSHCVKVFPIRLFSFLHPLLHLPISIDFLSAPHSPRPSPPSPLSFSFLPTFPSSSPINARSRAPSRNTRVRVHPYAPIRQEVFVYCLHLFTHLPQSAVHQHIRCE